jgi:hypothetical protein
MALQNEAEAGTVLREIKYAKPNGFYENGANAAFIQLAIANSEAFELHLLGGNPVQDQATFELSSPVETDVRLQLVDAQGQLVQTMLIQSNKGGQIVKLNSVENLKPGVYLLNAASQTQYTSVRFIKL